MILDKLRITHFLFKIEITIMNRQQKKKHEVDKMVIAKNVLKNIHHKSDSLIQVPVLCPMFLDWICEFVS